MTVLYKYLPPERIDVLEIQMIRLTQPGDLNDPAESQARFLKTRVAWDQFVDDVSDLLPNLRLKEGDFREFLNWLSLARRPIVQRKILQGVLDMGTGILSLSASRSIEAMWSHYADSHRGLVIGFDTKHGYFSREYGQILAPVKYSRQLHSFVHCEDMDVRSVFFTKSSSWAYEREWRLVKPLATTKRFLEGTRLKSKSGYDLWLERVPASAFYSVTIGVMMPQKLRVRIHNALLRPRFRHVKVCEAKLTGVGRLSFRELHRRS